MKSLILGGVKSGKSRYAESLATNSHLPVSVIATATAQDPEMRQRIARHQADRNPHWTLIEEPLELGNAITRATAIRYADDPMGSIDPADHAAPLNQELAHQPGNARHCCIIIDCLTLWLTNHLMQSSDGQFREQRQALLQAVQQCSQPLVMVSNENSLGVIPLGELSRRYCDEAGLLHQDLAACCDQVTLVVAGLPLCLKGAPMLSHSDHTI